MRQRRGERANPPRSGEPKRDVREVHERQRVAQLEIAVSRRRGEGEEEQRDGKDQPRITIIADGAPAEPAPCEGQREVWLRLGRDRQQVVGHIAPERSVGLPAGVRLKPVQHERTPGAKEQRRG